MCARFRRMPSLRCRLAAGLTATSLAAVCHAQTPMPMPEWIYSAGQQLRVAYLDGKLPTWDLNLGINSTLMPKYPGADQYRYQPGMSIDVRYKDWAFASTGEGLGVNWLHGKTYRVGTAVSYDLGRTEHRSERLYGLGNVDFAPELKMFAEYVWFPVTFRADVRHAFGGYNGWVGDLSLYSPVVGNKTFFLMIGPTVTFADANHMQSYFGVTPEQASHTEYPVYTPHGGLRSASFGANGTWFFADPWYFNFVLGAERLFEEAADSPIAATRMGAVGSLTLGYDFRSKH